MSKHTVIAILEAKPEEAAFLEAELLKIGEYSRKESYCQEYRVHKDKSNPAKFVLFENWDSAEDHKKQFEKPYILEFMQKADGKLAKPYEVIMAEEIK